jgi:tyrosinase
MHAITLLRFALFILVNVDAYDFGIDIEALTRRQDQDRILVGQLPPRTNGSVPHRLEIRQMRADPHKWDLFILALSMIQHVSQDDPLSWYQVAGTRVGLALLCFERRS